jgi:hypothetical protein
MLNNCEGLNKPGISIRENYYPLTGEGLNAEKGKYKKTSTPDSDPVIDNKSSDLARRPIGATIKSKAPVNGSCSVNSCFF